MKLCQIRTAMIILVASLMAGCATRPAPHDYTAFIKARPASLLVLPPLNDSPEVNATAGVWSQSTRPLAEAGYYVLPVTLVDETFRENGVTGAQEAHEVTPAKLRDYFGADAAVYLRIKRYGTSYAVITSDTRVEVEGRIVDLRTGEQLWQGKAVASSAEQQQAQSGLIALLVTAVVNQIINTASDAAFRYAVIADQRLLGTPQYNGVLPGPRSPLFDKSVAPTLR